MLLVGSVLLRSSNAESFPYNPTTSLISPKDSNLVYIFQPSTSTHLQAQLLLLNTSTTLQSTNLQTQVLTSSLPFLENATAGTAYTPAISSSGSIAVYAGLCSSTSTFWSWTPQTTGSTSSINSSNGTWTQASTTISSGLVGSGASGANFQASSFSFSTLVEATESQRTTYLFGGMCPTSATSNISTWQSAATYSNRMLKIAATSSSSTTYQVSVSAETANKPIAEAGFTMTGLTPTYSNSSSGIVTQAQNFVLIGGHTQTAFINMSQVALFSLPQESWSFQSISTSTAGNTELAVRAVNSQIPDSRSGHTALLTSDGSAIIIFGGWVGDVTQPASPQLAILHLGSGYGGSGDWRWEIPSTTGTGLASGAGIYGHGTVMLPGNVMMIVGGNIIASTTSKVKRATTGQAYFLNTTSMSWLPTYTNPSYTAAATTTGVTQSGSSDSAGNSRKIGLGAGLGIGLAAIIGAIGVYFWYSRRLKRKRAEIREKDLRSLSRGDDDEIFTGDGLHPGMGENNLWWDIGPAGGQNLQRDGLIPWATPTVNLGNRGMGVGKNLDYGPVAYQPYNGYGDYEDTFRTEGPFAARGSSNLTRKAANPKNARGYYQPTPNAYSGFDFGTASNNGRSNSLGTAGPIHPIYEADEDGEVADTHRSTLGAAVTTHIQDDGEPPLVSPIDRADDPFLEQPPDSQYRNTPSPETAAQAREREVASWVADWAAADAILNTGSNSQSKPYDYMHSGRVSPNKDSVSGRTGSNLSEASAPSIIALSPNTSTNNRSNSLTAFFANGGGGWFPFSGNSGVGSSTVVGTDARYDYGEGRISPESDKSGRNPPQSSGSNSGASFNTARTSQNFVTLKAEAETLLSPPRRAVHSTYDEPSSPSKAKATAFSRRRERSWLGSLKRVFLPGDDEWVSSDGSSIISRQGNRSPSFSGSPTRSEFAPSNPQQVEPRRTVSAGAALWRRKQGRNDWADSASSDAILGHGNRVGSRRSNTMSGEIKVPMLGRQSQEGVHMEDEDWDIEKAVQSRVVQVMFTVPKEKLRVVNQDLDDRESDEEAERVESSKPLVLAESPDNLLSTELYPEQETEVKPLEVAVTTPVKGKGKPYIPALDPTNTPDLQPPSAPKPVATRGSPPLPAQHGTISTPKLLTQISTQIRTSSPLNQPIFSPSSALHSEKVGQRIDGRRVGEIVGLVEGRPGSPGRIRRRVVF
jgi:hypothetical protein